MKYLQKHLKASTLLRTYNNGYGIIIVSFAQLQNLTCATLCESEFDMLWRGKECAIASFCLNMETVISDGPWAKGKQIDASKTYRNRLLVRAHCNPVSVHRLCE